MHPVPSWAQEDQQIHYYLRRPSSKYGNDIIPSVEAAQHWQHICSLKLGTVQLSKVYHRRTTHTPYPYLSRKLSPPPLPMRPQPQ